MTVSQLYKLTVTLRVRRQLRSHECKLLRIPRTRIKDGSRAECRSISAPRAVLHNIIQDDVVSWLFMRSSARVDFMRPAKAALIMHRSDAPQSFWHLRIKYPGPAAAAFFSDHRLVLNLPATLYTRSFPLASTILQLSCSKLYPVKMEYIKRW